MRHRESAEHSWRRWERGTGWLEYRRRETRNNRERQRETEIETRGGGELAGYRPDDIAGGSADGGDAVALTGGIAAATFDGNGS